MSINDENRARLELLMDEVMPGMRLGSITWRTRQGSNDAKGGFLSVDHEHVLVYGNVGFAFKSFTKTYGMYGNPDNDLRGDWRASDLTKAHDMRERRILITLLPYYPITLLPYYPITLLPYYPITQFKIQKQVFITLQILMLYGVILRVNG